MCCVLTKLGLFMFVVNLPFASHPRYRCDSFCMTFTGKLFLRRPKCVSCLQPVSVGIGICVSKICLLKERIDVRLHVRRLEVSLLCYTAY